MQAMIHTSKIPGVFNHAAAKARAETRRISAQDPPPTLIAKRPTRYSPDSHPSATIANRGDDSRLCWHLPGVVDAKLTR